MVRCTPTTLLNEYGDTWGLPSSRILAPATLAARVMRAFLGCTSLVTCACTPDESVTVR